MKNHLLPRLNLFLLILITVSLSCEKVETDYSNQNIVVKSQEIFSYINPDNEGLENEICIVPCKLYVKGGAPDHDKGDYNFQLATGSVLPGGISLDTLTGVLSSDGNPLDVSYKEFLLDISDGVKTTSSKCVISTGQGGRMALPVFQFSSPETNLISEQGSGYFAASFSVLGGTPPYLFSLPDKQKLPGKLTLNSVTGVVAGDISKLDAGTYNFKIICTDAKGNKAISFCTAGSYEEFNLIIK